MVPKNAQNEMAKNVNLQGKFAYMGLFLLILGGNYKVSRLGYASFTLTEKS